MIKPRWTLLVVDDEPQVRRSICQALRREFMDEFTVLEASCASEALRLVTALEGELHLLISDLTMPDIDGRDLARSIVQRLPATKVLFMSGYGPTAMEASDDLPAHFIQKPFVVSQLTTAVRAVLDTQS
jgi:two-component system cell cycle sensor histidine kinase/response regulator CckA